MSTKNKPVKPNCPMKGCRAKQPHIDDPLIKALVLRYTEPDKLLGWVQVSLGQIRLGNEVKGTIESKRRSDTV